MQPENIRVYNFQFWILCFSSFLFFSSFNMIIPELPGYLTSLGGADYKGFIIALFTLTAGFSRPFSGKLADKVGRIPVMILGAIISFIAALFYPFLLTVGGFLVLRFMHGFSTGFMPTGVSAYVADIVPSHRRGEAMGILGLSTSMGMAMGPAVGSYIASSFSLYTMFYTSSCVALLSIMILAGMRETLKVKQSFHISLLKISWKDVYEKRVLPPSLLMMLTVFSFGIILTIVPDFSEHLGIKNKGLFFLVFTISSLAIRLIAGKASDKYGRIIILKISCIILALAMVLTGIATSAPVFLAAAVIFGVGVGMNSPTVFAWTIDLSDDKHRGRAMATMYIALEIGIGTGALFSGFLYDNDARMFHYSFWSGAILAIVAFIYLQFFLPAQIIYQDQHRMVPDKKLTQP